MFVRLSLLAGAARTIASFACSYQVAGMTMRGRFVGPPLELINSDASMRIPLIERIRPLHAMVFATVLFVAQALEGTDLAFAGLTFAFVMLSVFAFNAAGGLIYPSGWFIFSTAVLTCILGLTYKVFLVEPGDSNLHRPNLSMSVYCVNMALMILVAVLARKIRLPRGLLARSNFGEDMRKAAIGSFLLGSVLQLLTFSVQSEGSFLAIIRQINYFTQMAILLGTYYEVRKSNGRKSTNWVVWAASTEMFVLGGFIGFSKQGFLAPLVSWLVTAMVAGHNFSRKQILFICFGLVVFQMYLVPYSQTVRNYRADDETLTQDMAIALEYVPRLSDLRREYLQAEKEARIDDSVPHLYRSSQGFFDRLNMLAPDDALIAYTAEGNEEGLLPTWWAILNVVPHFIWKDKPFVFTGNLYAREIGMVAEENEGTGISFSPSADAYHQASLWGVILLVPPFALLLFLVMDSLSGDIRQAPWGILFCVICTHSAPEGMIGGMISVATYGSFGVVVVAMLARYVLPLVTGVITNTDRSRVRKTTDFQPTLVPRSAPMGVKATSVLENP